jgi:hypothetical protein
LVSEKTGSGATLLFTPFGVKRHGATISKRKAAGLADSPCATSLESVVFRLKLGDENPRRTDLKVGTTTG